VCLQEAEGSSHRARMANRDVEVVRSRSRFVATLRRVADAIEQQEPVRIQVAGKRIVIPASAKLSIEHEVEGRDAELELQLQWKPPAASEPARATKAKKRKAAKKK
jgi:amphi-Trp domain-containing protein